MLQEIRPFQQAPPRKEGARGRKRGKTTILTSDQTFEEVRAEQEIRDAKQSAAEKRKEATAARKEAAALKKLTIAAKRAAKAKPETAPGRVSKRRKTVATYADISNSEEE